MPHALTALALADDLTGALETGAQLAAEGIACSVSVDGAPVEGVAGVVNLGTRHASVERTDRLIRQALIAQPEHVYLKTDSTLRGPIVASLATLGSLFPEREMHYVPAYPALGRTVRGGVLCVNGVPVDQTEFARDALNPVATSDLRRMLGGLRVTIWDGESEADLERAASAIGEHAIVAGTGAFAHYWARSLPLSRTPPARPPRVTNGVVVVGSRHPASRSTTEVPPGWRIIRLPDEDRAGALAHAALAARLVFERERPEALIVFGGDTAAAVLAALGVAVAYPHGEVIAGVPVSRIVTRARDVTLVTKAGGFGDHRTLGRIVEILG